MTKRIRAVIVAAIALALAAVASPSTAKPPSPQCLIGPLTVAGHTVDVNNDGCFP